MVGHARRLPAAAHRWIEGRISDYDTRVQLWTLGQEEPLTTVPVAGANSGSPVSGAAQGASRFDAFFRRSAQWVPVAVLVGSFFMPVKGLKFDICWFHRFTGLPCPGCGMTRAFASISHGQLGHALQMHPFVVLAYPLFVAIGALALLPARWREPVVARLTRHRKATLTFYRLAVAAFLAFGFARLAVFLIRGQRFP